MPYIEPAKREACEFEGAVPQTPGELNYAITALCHRYIKAKGLSYTNCNEVVGVLSCAMMEFYRVVTAPYEDVKREENGPVSEFDKPVDVDTVTISQAGPVVVDAGAILKLLEERLPAAQGAAPAARKNQRRTTGPLPPAPAAAAPAEAPKTSNVRRPARSIGVSPMGTEAPPNTPVARPAPERPEIPTGKKLDPEAKRVSDVWANAASGNGEEDI